MSRSATVRCCELAGAVRVLQVTLSTFDLTPEEICLLYNSRAQRHLTRPYVRDSERADGSNVRCSEQLYKADLTETAPGRPRCSLNATTSTHLGAGRAGTSGASR